MNGYLFKEKPVLFTRKLPRIFSHNTHPTFPPFLTNHFSTNLFIIIPHTMSGICFVWIFFISGHSNVPATVLLVKFYLTSQRDHFEKKMSLFRFPHPPTPRPASPPPPMRRRVTHFDGAMLVPGGSPPSAQNLPFWISTELQGYIMSLSKYLFEEKILISEPSPPTLSPPPAYPHFNIQNH